MIKLGDIFYETSRNELLVIHSFTKDEWNQNAAMCYYTKNEKKGRLFTAYFFFNDESLIKVGNVND